jgi:hypothetical protein
MIGAVDLLGWKGRSNFYEIRQRRQSGASRFNHRRNRHRVRVRASLWHRTRRQAGLSVGSGPLLPSGAPDTALFGRLPMRAQARREMHSVRLRQAQARAHGRVDVRCLCGVARCGISGENEATYDGALYIVIFHLMHRWREPEAGSGRLPAPLPRGVAARERRFSWHHLQ